MNNMNNLNNMPRERKIILGVVAAAVLLCAIIGVGSAAFMAGTMAGASRANYAVQGYGPRQLPGNPPDAQGDVIPAQPEPVRPGPRMMNRGGWGHGPVGFFGGIFRVIGTILFIGFIFFLVRMIFFRGRGWGRGWGRGPWGYGRGWGGPWGGPGGPGQGNSGVPPHFDNTPNQTPNSDVNNTTNNASNTAPSSTADKPQNPDAL